MEPEIRKVPAFTVIGLRDTITQPGDGRIPQLWKGLHARQGEIVAPDGAAAFGLCIHAATPGTGFDYLAGIEAEESAEAPDGMTRFEIPARTCAVLTVEVTPDTLAGALGNAFAFLWKTWLPASDFRPAGGVEYERYDERFDPKALCGIVEVHVAVEMEA